MPDLSSDFVLSILLILCAVIIGIVIDFVIKCFHRPPFEKCNKILPEEISVRVSVPSHVDMITVTQDGKILQPVMSRDLYADGAGPKHLATWKPCRNSYTKSLMMKVNNTGGEFNITLAKLKNNNQVIREFRIPIGALGVHEYDLLPIICSRPLIDKIRAR